MNRNLIAIIIFFLVIPVYAMGQRGQENIRREVTLYNPFKPSLNKASKISFFPEISDSSIVVPEFRYDISPRSFMPEYEIKTIRAARLEPDPLPKLYKGFLNLGFGNYFSPLAELSISSERSRKTINGLYINHQSSFGKVNIEGDNNVYAGYMDNMARLYTRRFLRRSAMAASIDFDHIRRYAYGGDPEIILPSVEEKDSLRIDYFNPRANLKFYSERMDSSKLNYDISLYYDLLYQTNIYYQHLAGASMDFGYDLDIFYAGLHAGYEMLTITNIEDKFRHLVNIGPSISKRSSNWEFRLGFNVIADARYYDDDVNPREYRTDLSFHPDLRFAFSVIPDILGLYVGLDGEHINNKASNIIYSNPFIVNQDISGKIEPSFYLYTLLPTDIPLRVKGGINGSASENTNYGLSASYSLFEDMLFFTNDIFQGRGFVPIYDNGELLSLRGDFNIKVNDKIDLEGNAGYYSYKLESLEQAWHKPSWDANFKVNYNLRNKILASAGLYGVSKRFARFGPMAYSGSSDYDIEELPMFISVNLRFEYRYTKILSFWAKLENLSTARYYEWNFYPSQRFIFQAGFTYSL